MPPKTHTPQKTDTNNPLAADFEVTQFPDNPSAQQINDHRLISGGRAQTAQEKATNAKEELQKLEKELLALQKSHQTVQDSPEENAAQQRKNELQEEINQYAMLISKTLSMNYIITREQGGRAAARDRDPDDFKRLNEEVKSLLEDDEFKSAILDDGLKSMLEPHHFSQNDSQTRFIAAREGLNQLQSNFNTYFDLKKRGSVTPETYWKSFQQYRQQLSDLIAPFEERRNICSRELSQINKKSKKIKNEQSAEISTLEHKKEELQHTIIHQGVTESLNALSLMLPDLHEFNPGLLSGKRGKEKQAIITELNSRINSILKSAPSTLEHSQLVSNTLDFIKENAHKLKEHSSKKEDGFGNPADATSASGLLVRSFNTLSKYAKTLNNAYSVLDMSINDINVQPLGNPPLSSKSLREDSNRFIEGVLPRELPKAPKPSAKKING